jgi:hypothetical protein
MMKVWGIAEKTLKRANANERKLSTGHARKGQNESV